MTCVVGLEDKGVVWLGSDSYLGADDYRDILDRPKWFRKGPLVFAYAGDFRAAQILEHAILIRQPRKGEKQLSFLTNAVARAMQDGMNVHGVHRNNGEIGAGFLLVYGGLLYIVQEDFSVVRSRRGYAALGAGANYALGAIAALKNRLPPRECLTEALQHSAEWSPKVCKPFTIESFG